MLGLLPLVRTGIRIMRGTQCLMERADSVDQSIEGEGRQRNCGDPLQGEQDGVTAVPADVDHYYRPVLGVAEEFVRFGRGQECLETLPAADVGQDAANLMMTIVGFLPARDPRMLATIEATADRLTSRRRSATSAW